MVSDVHGLPQFFDLERIAQDARRRSEERASWERTRKIYEGCPSVCGCFPLKLNQILVFCNVECPLVCPRPTRLFLWYLDECADRRQGILREPSGLALLLADWSRTSDGKKRTSFRQYLVWAHNNAQNSWEWIQFINRMKSLKEADWKCADEWRHLDTVELHAMAGSFAGYWFPRLDQWREGGPVRDRDRRRW